MSGGVSYVFDENGDFDTKCNKNMVGLEKIVDNEEENKLKMMIQKHYEYTNSDVAKKLLDNWNSMVGKFVKVMPIDYKRMLQAIKQISDQGITGEEALMAAFDANNKDLARVSGN
jgi:glutamate synthase (ferredoxin)